MNKTKKWGAEDKLNAVILTASMTEVEKSGYCRQQGLYPEELTQWKQTCLAGFGKQTKSPESRQSKILERKLKKETKRLRKELTRKDRALAETAALLVLKKKAQELWGEPEDAE